MKVEVSGELLGAAMRAWVDSDGDLRAALAAVIPTIQAEALERCARVAETHEWFVGGIGTKAPGSGESKSIAAAIRALKEPT